MRTTVTLDDDVFRVLRKIMHDEEKTFKQTLNETLRRALQPGGGARVKRRRFRVRPHNSPFRAGVDPARLNQLADQLEVEQVRVR